MATYCTKSQHPSLQALFAVGNLAYALRSHSALIVPASGLVRVYELAVEAMDDKNGKVSCFQTPGSLCNSCGLPSFAEGLR